MTLRNWLAGWFGRERNACRRRTGPRLRKTYLFAELLENRSVPSIKTLGSFDGGNGSQPLGGLVVDAGNLFGTTNLGGDYGFGTIFQVTPGDPNPITAFASFDGSGNGAGPRAGLVEDASGNLFGTAYEGGPSDQGTVFEAHKGDNKIIVLASFDGTHGANPKGGVVVDASDNLFGTTSYGGSKNQGTVFEVVQGSGTVTTLATFTGDNGANPSAGVIEDSSGNLFGTTDSGGDFGAGTVYEVNSGSGKITTLASFNNSSQVYPRVYPSGLVEDTGGNLFGTTYQGGSADKGTVFEVVKDSGTVTALASFTGSNGSLPEGGLLMDGAGDLFATTTGGGNTDNGTVFVMLHGSATITTIASFQNNVAVPGASPLGNLAMDASGNLYGTTEFGGTSDVGTVFEVPALPSGTFGQPNYSQTITASGGPGPTTFTSSGGLPPGLTLSTNGILSGTPTLAGTYTFVVTATDANGGSTSQTCTLTINAAVSISIATLPNWTVDWPGYNQSISAAGGTGTLTFSASGTLPTGLTLSAGGQLTGTPTTAGTFTFTVTATDTVGASGSQTYTVIINPSVAIAPTTLPDWTINQPGYNQTIAVSGGTGSLTVSLSGTLPPGLTLGSGNVLSGTPTATGSFTLTVTATDGVGASASQSYTVTIKAPPVLSSYQVTIVGSPTIQAGIGFLVTVQAVDQYGDPITNYSGPATVTATLTPASAASSFPTTVSISNFGLGFFLASVQEAGSYTIFVADSSGSLTGNSSVVSIMPGPAAKLAFAAQPVSTPTGDPLPAVSVQVEDAYGNLTTTDNTDTVGVGIASGPGPFTSGSTVTAAVTKGVATFNNLILVAPGSYQLCAVDPGLYTGPDSASFTVLPLQVVPGSFAGTPSGFSLQLNAPILVNSVTPALYGSGAGASATVTPSVTLTQTTGTPPTGTALPYQVPGSLIVDSTTNTLTFVETDTASVVGNGTPLLPDGTYMVHIASSGANGLQALNAGGGYLDGTNSGTPGQDFTATFTVGAAAAGDDVLWVPATADGPGQPLEAPGKNQVGGGYPIYLSDKTGMVSSVQATLTYNPALLTVTPTSTSTFTVMVPSPGTAVLHYNGPPLPGGLQTPIGYLTAMVPAGTATTPTPYKARDLLHLSGVALNGGAIPLVSADALHLVAYVGDADGNGSYSSNDAVLITRALLSADSGFAAYPLVDPVIVADTDGSGFIPADAALQANAAGVGVSTANLPIPPIPGGVHFQAVVFDAHAVTSLPTSPQRGTERVMNQPAAQRPGRRPVAGRAASAPLLDFFITDRKILDLFFARLEP